MRWLNTSGRAVIAVTRPPAYPVPDRANTALALGVATLHLLLLWAGSHVANGPVFLGICVAFAYLMLTSYGLLHEGMHDNLHSRPATNYLLGLLAGSLFPVPFSLAHATHQGHHLRNRTDFEMFDQYYPSGNRFVRTVQWYGTLCGTFYPTALLGTVLLALCPWLLGTRPFRRAASTSYIVNDILQGPLATRVRGEFLLVVGAGALVYWTLDLRWQSVLVMYALAGFNWSTRQYIDHAYTKRDVIEGALNLRHSRVMQLILLNANYNLTHHRHPEIPWCHLPRATPADTPSDSYHRQYLRMWRRGPVVAREPPPEALQKLPLSIFASR